MPPLNQISKEEIEKFDEKYKFEERFDGDYLEGLNLLKEAQVKDIIASHLRLIDGMEKLIEEISTEYKCTCMSGQYDECPCWKGESGKGEFKRDLLSRIHSEKENIKNESNK